MENQVTPRRGSLNNVPIGARLLRSWQKNFDEGSCFQRCFAGCPAYPVGRAGAKALATVKERRLQRRVHRVLLVTQACKARSFTAVHAESGYFARSSYHSNDNDRALGASGCARSKGPALHFPNPPVHLDP